MPSPKLKVTKVLSKKDRKQIADRLIAYNIEHFGESDRQKLAIRLRDDAGMLSGGLVGYTARGWLYVEMLFVPEEMRGQGLAGRLLQMAEDEARRRGCVGAYIDTMSPLALGVYKRQGYEPVGSLEEMTGGHSLTWLKKRFS
ncbi:GNAT family N-acetyltransferase [Rhizobium grahamii]|uniref:GNAT family N-acetyltransferase n=1 Tax=Rhizobium grahamii TaxID=1120045 RepID=A0A5Q0C8V8_9HYPH|nr:MULTISPECIES: GNAT family N-acetyltransferase [Rhizobium]QFY60804.1 GNAT family N-acetyltransferase [Rhizobium grahamii]QRM50048.1 GNAT family N-acetyltransferase [Rhizobium sp. BG6]